MRPFCPDCGLQFPQRTNPASEKAPYVCSACLSRAVPAPPGGWALETRWTGENRGRGVFATAPHAQGALIERCWVMPLDAEESTRSLTMPVLNRYLFPWFDGTRCIISGAGLLYNFDSPEATRRDPNTECVLRRGISAIEFRALRDIGAGEELTWDYQKARARRS